MCFTLFVILQPVSNTCKSLIYGLMVIVLALFDEDTLGELQVHKKLCPSYSNSLNSSSCIITILNNGVSYFV